ncbi:xanthine dehydrogenase family protein molybdopterin-binding subunit [Telmatospirillum sp. J64-1]|uniref:xanthine dehydrogenase family protein molybdopterin-binding subunit n=1 Tax=Telmatospirillum sp. J64-1 TaxID=2502183 RepID=UPI00115C7D72|nr:xanthine dehydrogenase family protein molybdopterin-binding subunit [Telmatospirillum sp. J64-1]
MTPMHVLNSYVGSPVERIEDLRLLRGKGQFVDDLTREGLLHAAILRSNVAHGRILSIETRDALDLPGVHAVLTAPDFGPSVPVIPLRLMPMPSLEPFAQPVIASDKVRYVGEPVAVVLAESAAIAEDALELIYAEIEPLPAIVDGTKAGDGQVLLVESSGTNEAAQYSALLGDVERAFQEAEYVRREKFRVHRHTALPMEPRGILAEWDQESERLVVWGAAKVPFANRRILAQQMGLAEEDIDMIENDVGGGFGVRGEFYPEDFLVPFAARLTGRPVKWIEDRREHLIATNHAREVDCEVEIACRKDGTILGLRGSAFVDMGAYLRTNGVIGPRNVAQFLVGPYLIPNVAVTASLMMTNKTPVGTYRGPGRYEADFFRERLFDMVARDLGIDRVEFRRRNLVPEDMIPYALPTVTPVEGRTQFDSGDYQATLARCLEEIGWDEKAALQGRLIDGRYHGLGIGCFVEGGGTGPRETARLVVEADGTLSVFVGTSAVGQGLETACAQIAADALEVPMERVRIYHGSTTYVREGFGSFHSRAVVMGGSAIQLAAEALKEKVREAGARHLGCSPDEARIVDWTAVTAGGKSVELAELAAEDLTAEHTFANTKHTYSYGAHAAHVAVDPKTGAVEVLDYLAVEDVGRAINPLTLHGQTIGAIVQGLGGTLLEHLIYDENGQLLTGSLADYMMPTASDYPNIRVVTLQLRPSPVNPLGAKGAGEGGIIPVGGVIANAVAAALAPFDVQPRELPLSPPRVWAMLKTAREGAIV